MNAIERRLALRQGVHQQTIRFSVWSEVSQLGNVPDLAHFGCEQVGVVNGDLFDSETAARCDVLVIRTKSNLTGANNGVIQIIAQAAAAEVGVCVVVDDGVSLANQYLSNGADSAAFAGESAAVLAVALFAAHNAAVVRRNLRTRVAELERKLEQTKIINQAKSILAEQMGIGEGAALRHLRHEARNQRRSMSDLAQVIIEARRLIDRMSQPNGDGKGTRLTPFPKQSDAEVTRAEARQADDEDDFDHAAS